MEQQINNVGAEGAIQIDPIEAGIDILSILTAIGGSAVIGACLGMVDLSKVGGIAKIFIPLGIAGLSSAGGYAAGDAMGRKTRTIKTICEVGMSVANQKLNNKQEQVPNDSGLGQIDN